ncbi:MAG: metallophosphoesterase [Roseibium sp.]|uniref:metallophosphoesterase n=1 Tax=Roseibium sp. TaxID=1936156 RepID=UPI00329A3D7D
MQKYDFIPDVHGNYARLTQTLDALGYDLNDHQHPEGRIAAFLGDFIDRGRQNGPVLKHVRAMVEAGSAVAIMGNHELNAILFHTPDGRGDWLRRRSTSNIKQHRTFLDEFEPGGRESEDHIAWMMSLPLYLDLDGARMVHASWDQKAIDTIAERRPDGRLHPDDLPSIGEEDKSDPFTAAVINSLKGPERRLPKGGFFLDNHGNERKKIRLKWWELNPDTWRDIMISVPNPVGVPATPFPEELLPTPYLETEPPVFIGHYQRYGPVSFERDNVLCLDHPEVLAAYSWNGEQTLRADGVLDPTRRREENYSPSHFDLER